MSYVKAIEHSKNISDLKLGYYNLNPDALFAYNVPYTICDTAKVASPNYTVYKYPVVKQIIFNNPATIVYWEDGTKTVVKTMDGDIFDESTGVAFAFMKKIYGSNSNFKRLVKKYIKEETK